MAPEKMEFNEPVHTLTRESQRPYGRRDYDLHPMTPELMDSILSNQAKMDERLKNQCDKIDKLIDTVGEMRDYYMVQRALLPVIKWIGLAGLGVGFMVLFFMATGKLPIKEIVELLLKFASSPAFAGLL